MQYQLPLASLFNRILREVKGHTLRLVASCSIHMVCSCIKLLGTWKDLFCTKSPHVMYNVGRFYAKSKVLCKISLYMQLGFFQGQVLANLAMNNTYYAEIILYCIKCPHHQSMVEVTKIFPWDNLPMILSCKFLHKRQIIKAFTNQFRLYICRETLFTWVPSFLSVLWVGVSRLILAWYLAISRIMTFRKYTKQHT